MDSENHLCCEIGRKRDAHDLYAAVYPHDCGHLVRSLHLAMGKGTGAKEEAIAHLFYFIREVWPGGRSCECAEQHLCHDESHRVVNETDGMEVALNSFDRIVRAELPRAMASSMGRRCLPLRYCVIMSVTLIGAAFDFLASDLAAGETPRVAAPRCLFWLFWAFPGSSLLCLCVALMTSRCLHLKGVCEGSYLVLVSVSALVFASILCCARCFEWRSEASVLHISGDLVYSKHGCVHHHSKM